MRTPSVVVGTLWFFAAYYGLGVFVESSAGYYFIGILSSFLFLIVEQKL
jgi:hypothetical protein